MTLVADTSALVSLASVGTDQRHIVDRFFEGYDVVVPRMVVEELEDIARYDDGHGRAARIVVDEDGYDVREVALNPDFPLDDGENAAVQLANKLDADYLYCDEYNRLALVHASLSAARLVTTPRLLQAFVMHGDLNREEALAVLDEISTARSWAENAYVQQTRSWFADE